MVFRCLQNCCPRAERFSVKFPYTLQHKSTDAVPMSPIGCDEECPWHELSHPCCRGHQDELVGLQRRLILQYAVRWIYRYDGIVIAHTLLFSVASVVQCHDGHRSRIGATADSARQFWCLLSVSALFLAQSHGQRC